MEQQGRHIIFRLRAEVVRHSLSVRQPESTLWRGIMFDGYIVDLTGEELGLNYEDPKVCRFHGSVFQLEVVESFSNELNARTKIISDLESPASSSDLAPDDGLPPLARCSGWPRVMGTLILPADAFHALRLQVGKFDQVNKFGQKLMHHIQISLSCNAECFNTEHPEYPEIPEISVPLPLINLEKSITINGCDSFYYCQTWE